MSIEIIKTDITDMEVDAIVNAANTSLLRGGGVCGAIFKKAGFELDKECNEIGHCDTGEAVITKGYNLKAKYIIHAVAPVWNDYRNKEKIIFMLILSISLLSGRSKAYGFFVLSLYASWQANRHHRKCIDTWTCPLKSHPVLRSNPPDSQKSPDSRKDTCPLNSSNCSQKHSSSW